MTLKQMRDSKGLTSAYVASQLGISRRQFNRIESNEGYLTPTRIKIMSKLYGIKMSEIEEGAKHVRWIN